MSGYCTRQGTHLGLGCYASSRCLKHSKRHHYHANGLAFWEKSSTHDKTELYARRSRGTPAIGLDSLSMSQLLLASWPKHPSPASRITSSPASGLHPFPAFSIPLRPTGDRHVHRLGPCRLLLPQYITAPSHRALSLPFFPLQPSAGGVRVHRRCCTP